MSNDTTILRTSAVPMTVDQCVQAADIHVVGIGHDLSIVARFPLQNGTMLFASILMKEDDLYPWPSGRGRLIESATCETILAGDYKPVIADFEQSYDRYEDTLRRCGLYLSGDDPFSLSEWRDLLFGGGDAVPDLDLLTQVWSEKIEAAGIPALRRHIDAEALDLLRFSSLDILSDDHAYSFVRGKADDPSCREVLKAYPMIFGEIWCSPEVMEDLSSTPIRKTLIEDGLSCETTEYGRYHEGLPPLPEWLVDWILEKKFAHSTEYPRTEDFSSSVCGALSLLKILGEHSAPEKERDWQALVELANDITTIFWRENWQELFPEDAWMSFLAGAGNRWSDYLLAIEASYRPGDRSSRVIWGILDSIWDEAELSLDDHAEPVDSEDRARLVAAFSRLSLRDRIAGLTAMPSGG